jgi:endoglucanase
MPSTSNPGPVRHSLNRREFLTLAAAAGTVCAFGAAGAAAQAAAPAALPEPSPKKLPRWRGFNLTEKFNADSNKPFAETDFEWIAGWGFNFVRLPMSYRCWATADDWLKLKEPVLKEVDAAVELGRKHGIHTNLNLHRAPGYCVNPPAEPKDLWTDEAALAAAAFHWGHLARRYRGIPNANVSFDLLNEPKDLPVATYRHVVLRLVEAIRAEDANRLIIADGLKWGTAPVPALADLGIGQSTRGYSPMQISHYQASWVHGADEYPLPTWPLQQGDKVIWDKDRLRRECLEPWKKLESQGVGVHVGEWGAFNRTPHAVVLAWMRDQLALWQAAGWGWSLWNLRGSFGVLDSGRADVEYEAWHGHKLDRAMLELLQAG